MISEAFSFVVQGSSTTLGLAWAQYLREKQTECMKTMVASEPGHETEQARGGVILLDEILREIRVGSISHETPETVQSPYGPEPSPTEL